MLSSYRAYTTLDFSLHGALALCDFSIPLNATSRIEKISSLHDVNKQALCEVKNVKPVISATLFDIEQAPREALSLTVEQLGKQASTKTANAVFDTSLSLLNLWSKQASKQASKHYANI